MGWLLAVDAENLNMKDMTSPKWQAPQMAGSEWACIAHIQGPFGLLYWSITPV